MPINQPYDSPEARDMIRKLWNHLLRQARAELDEITIAAGLGSLIGEWLSELPDSVADGLIRYLEERLEEIRAGVS